MRTKRKFFNSKTPTIKWKIPLKNLEWNAINSSHFSDSLKNIKWAGKIISPNTRHSKTVSSNWTSSSSNSHKSTTRSWAKKKTSLPSSTNSPKKSKNTQKWRDTLDLEVLLWFQVVLFCLLCRRFLELLLSSIFRCRRSFTVWFFCWYFGVGVRIS